MDAATLEETNRIRVSLGMKPLPVPGAPAPQATPADENGELPSTLESRQAQSYDNYNKAMEAEAAKRRREEKAAAVRKARDKAQRDAIIEGKGLGEEDGADLSAKDWLVGQKKRQKKISKVRKLEEELAAAEAAAAAAVQYTSKDLAGIKVAHDTANFLDGDEQILTLKDTTIDQNEEEGDELENLEMREAELLSDRMDLKKRTRQYNPHDDDGDNTILSQYDEEINGKKQKKFTLDAGGVIAALSDILEQPVDKTATAQNVRLDDIVGDAPLSSDYLDPSQIKIKKTKKKKSKNTRQRPVDEDDIFPIEPVPTDNNAMEIDSKDATNKKRKMADDTFVDDEDLQASLAMQRKNALKKRKKSRPEDIAKQLREQEEDEQQVETQEGGLVLGEVSGFVAGLNKPEESEVRRPKKSTPASRSPRPEEDHPMDDHDDQEETEPDQPRTASALDDGLDENGVEAEKNVGQGMASALALLRERGLIEQSRGETDYESFRAREDFLAKKRRLEEELDEQTRQQRERDRMHGKLDRMSTREREEYARQQNTWRDQQQSRRMAELFSAGYKPKVELKYTDEHGRSLDQKEAFKHLSHQFHGKGSGKGKTEKLLKKIEEEKRREAQSLFDANQSAGMNMAAQQQLKKRREAGVRLA
ncbi:SART-1 protein [Mariannaea sp. PMI_226]|nr:SART-1 protein [Mariannaea sp. PMI_226]